MHATQNAAQDVPQDMGVRSVARAVLSAAMVIIAVALAPGTALGAEVDTPPAAEPVGLDSLLKLPAGYGDDVETRQGATRREWRERFDRVRTELALAREKLAQTEKELDSVSGQSSTWQVSAPGAATSENSPLSFRLRQDVKNRRAEIKDAERRLRALDVEADLAKVPTDWRQ